MEWINTTWKISKDVVSKNILTKKDIQKLVDAAKNSRDETLIAMLWETGARIDELIDPEIGT